MSRILVVENELHLSRTLVSNLTQVRHEVHEARGVAEANRILAASTFDVVFTAQDLPDGGGLQVLAATRNIDPTISVVFLTAHGNPEKATATLRQGAFDSLAKPFQPGLVRVAAERAAERTRLLRENDFLKGTVERIAGTSDLCGKSMAMQTVRQGIARVASTSATVLISGEAGTGKERAAHAIHENSQRASRPFVPVNCASLPADVLERELFGYERNSFPGADQGRPGRFETAHQGTLFLDELGEISATVQSKLLSVLTEGQVFRLGSSKARMVDVRVIASTHTNLAHLVKSGIFREDLYYRLAVIPLYLAPLRERREDIPDLCNLFCRHIAEDLSLTRRRLSPGAVKVLQEYNFPGNVRELRNLIERAFLLSSEVEIGPESFPLFNHSADKSAAEHENLSNAAMAGHSGSVPSFNLPQYLEKLEAKLIASTLASTSGAQAEAARRMGVSRSVLAYKLKKYGIRPELVPDVTPQPGAKGFEPSAIGLH